MKLHEEKERFTFTKEYKGRYKNHRVTITSGSDEAFSEEIKMHVEKSRCDVCKKENESTYSKNTKQYMCEECWDDYGEACHYGLA